MSNPVNLLRCILYFGSILLGIVCGPGSMLAQKVSVSPRPVSEAATYLESLYAKSITYEDPVWVGRGELQPLGADSSAKWGLMPAMRSLTLANPGSLQPPNLEDYLKTALDSYNLANGTSGPTFGMKSWKLGFHIIPTRAYGANGRLEASRNPLDSIISVPKEVSGPSEHFAQLCAAITAATGIHVELDASGVTPMWLEQLFAADPKGFERGGNTLIARDALHPCISPRGSLQTDPGSP